MEENNTSILREPVGGYTVSYLRSMGDLRVKPRGTRTRVSWQNGASVTFEAGKVIRISFPGDRQGFIEVTTMDGKLVAYADKDKVSGLNDTPLDAHANPVKVPSKVFLLWVENLRQATEMHALRNIKRNHIVAMRSPDSTEAWLVGSKGTLTAIQSLLAAEPFVKPLENVAGNTALALHCSPDNDMLMFVECVIGLGCGLDYEMVGLH